MFDVLKLANITIQENPLPNIIVDTGISSDAIQKAGALINTIMTDGNNSDISDIINYIGLQNVKDKYIVPLGITSEYSNFKVITAKIPLNKSLADISFGGFATNVIIPQSLIYNSILNSTFPLTYLYAEIKKDLHRPSNSSYDISSSLVRIAFFNKTNEIQLPNLTVPINMTFSNITLKSNQQPVCRFYNVSKGLYSTFGLQLVNFTTKNNSVVCSTSHLTDFAIFPENKIITSSKVYLRISKYFKD